MGFTWLPSLGVARESRSIPENPGESPAIGLSARTERFQVAGESGKES